MVAYLKNKLFSSKGAAGIPYKTYVALLNQSGTAAPVPTVIENTIVGTPTWSRASAGRYDLTITGAFTSGKTTVLIHNPDVGSLCVGARTDNNTVRVNTTNSSFTYEDDLLSNASIEIRVYP